MPLSQDVIDRIHRSTHPTCEILRTEPSVGIASNPFVNVPLLRHHPAEEGRTRDSRTVRIPRWHIVLCMVMSVNKYAARMTKWVCWSEVASCNCKRLHCPITIESSSMRSRRDKTWLSISIVAFTVVELELEIFNYRSQFSVC